MLKGIIPYAHHLLESTITEGDIVVDATCGNGNDSLFLASLVGNSGHVYAFDIQEQAIRTTTSLLNDHHYSNVSVIKDSHSNAKQYLEAGNITKIGGAIFNLGYLPRSDKQIITTSSSTIPAIEQLLSFLQKGRFLILVVYHGHDGGNIEKEDVLAFTSQLDQKQYNVLQYQFINQKNNPPFVIAIKKRLWTLSLTNPSLCYAKQNAINRIGG